MVTIQAEAWRSYSLTLAQTITDKAKFDRIAEGEAILASIFANEAIAA